MNGKEQITVNAINKKLDNHIELCNKQYNDILPIIQSFKDQRVIDKFIRNAMTGVVSALGILATIGIICKMVWEVFFKK